MKKKKIHFFQFFSSSLFEKLKQISPKTINFPKLSKIWGKKITTNYYKLPKVSKSCHNLSKVATGSHKLPKVVKSCQIFICFYQFFIRLFVLSIVICFYTYFIYANPIPSCLDCVTFYQRSTPLSSSLMSSLSSINSINLLIKLSLFLPTGFAVIFIFVTLI